MTFKELRHRLNSNIERIVLLRKYFSITQTIVRIAKKHQKELEPACEAGDVYAAFDAAGRVVASGGAFHLAWETDVGGSKLHHGVRVLPLGEVRLGVSGPGMARRVLARPGSAWHGPLKARLGMV